MSWRLMNSCTAALPALLIAVCCGCQETTEPQLGAAEAEREDLVTVKVVRPQRKTLSRSTTQPATVHAYHQAELFSKVAGYLKELKIDADIDSEFDIGSEVDAGQVLAVIDVPEMEKAREKQEATIRKLKADERRAEAFSKLAAVNVTVAEALRKQADAQIKQIDAQLTAAEAEFERVKELVKNDAVAKRLLDEAQKKFESSQAEKTAVEAAFESAQANVSVAGEKRAVAMAEWESAQEATTVARKQLEEMDVLMGYAMLKAPFKGVITERNVDPGDLVRNFQTASNGSQRPLFSIAQLDRVRVRVAVPENDAPSANKGDPVTLRLRAFAGRSFDSTISRIAHRLDESTRTMLVEFDLPNPEGMLIPGMYGEATITLEEKPDALMLPAGAVRYNEDGDSYVYTIDSNNKVKIVDVQTGSDDGKQIEITSGLDDVSRVVDSMIGRLAAGQKVKIQE